MLVICGNAVSAGIVSMSTSRSSIVLSIIAVIVPFTSFLHIGVHGIRGKQSRSRIACRDFFSVNTADMPSRLLEASNG